MRRKRLGVGHHRLDFLDAAQHRAERDELAAASGGRSAAPAWSCRRPAVPTESATSARRARSAGAAACPGPRMCSWPTKSSRRSGRMRSASGRFASSADSDCGGVISNRLTARASSGGAPHTAGCRRPPRRSAIRRPTVGIDTPIARRAQARAHAVRLRCR